MSYKEKKYDELTEEEKAFVDKKLKVNMLTIECHDYLIDRFFDVESDEMLDLKLEALTKIANGKRNEVSQEDYYKILELYPKDEGTLWD